VGVKVTLIVQLVPAASEELQLLVWVKSPEFVPLTEMLLMVRVALPELLRVRAMGALLVPTA